MVATLCTEMTILASLQNFSFLKDFVFPVDISSILYYNTCEKNHLVSDSIQNLKSSLN